MVNIYKRLYSPLPIHHSPVQVCDATKMPRRTTADLIKNKHDKINIMYNIQKLIVILVIACMQFATANAQSCDTVKYDAAVAGWSAVTYYAPGPFGPSYPAGYVAGSNGYTYILKANYFDISSTSYSYLQGAMIKFLKANSNNAANLSKIVYFKVFADSSGVPASTVLGSAQKTLGDIKTDVDAGGYTLINFASPIMLPASKKFYVAVDVSNLTWVTGGSNHDSLCIATTKDDEVSPSTAWDYSTDDSTWATFASNWDNPNQNNNDLNVNLWIFPYVSVTSAGCGVLPVHLISFNAIRSNNDVTLKWEVSSEMNMKGYNIEKANNNGNYQSIAFVPAGNNMKNQTYTATDRNAFSTSSTVQYRLKQVNADGSASYSRIITLNHNAAFTDVVFQNPFSNTLKVQLTLSSSQKIGLQLYDMRGRRITVNAETLYSAGVNTILINNTTTIKPGIYLLKVNAGNDQMVYKVVKQ